MRKRSQAIVAAMLALEWVPRWYGCEAAKQNEKPPPADAELSAAGAMILKNADQRNQNRGDTLIDVNILEGLNRTLQQSSASERSESHGQFRPQ